MRTPGNDFELAAGFLYSEGLIAGAGDVAAVKYCELPLGADQQSLDVLGSLDGAAKPRLDGEPQLVA